MGPRHGKGWLTKLIIEEVSKKSAGVKPVVIKVDNKTMTTLVRKWTGAQGYIEEQLKKEKK